MTMGCNVGRILRDWVLFTGSLLVVGCDSDPSTGTGAAGNGNGQVTDAWRGYCVATFTKDTAIEDVFGDPAFTARAGEEYLLAEYDSFGGEATVEIAYLTPNGPETYSVPMSGGAADSAPFTSNCTQGTAVEYYAVFADVTVYEDEALTKAICTLPAGTAVVRDGSLNAGYSAMSLNFSGPQKYEIMLNALGARCGGAETGYVSVPSVELFGTTTWLSPLGIVLKPE